MPCPRCYTWMRPVDVIEEDDGVVFNDFHLMCPRCGYVSGSMRM